MLCGVEGTSVVAGVPVGSAVDRFSARLDSVSPYLMDTLLAVLALAAAFIMIEYGNPRPVGQHQLRWWGYALAAGTGVPLVWRRRAPFSVAMAVAVCASVYGNLPIDPRPPIPFGVLIAAYTVADQARPWQRRTGILVGAVGILRAFPTDFLTSQQQPLLTIFGAYALGAVVRTRRGYAVGLESRARYLERERDLEAERSALRERARIAREMHDILGHAVSLMVVQAEAGPVVVRSDPDRAVAVFDAVARAGREAMAQVRRLLGLLAADDVGAGRLAPQPSLTDLDAMIDAVRDSGLAVTVRRVGLPRQVPADLEAAVFRTVQEALTNTVKHAGAIRAEVLIEWAAQELLIRVGDDGRGDPGNAREHLAGRGLIGIQERAAAFGGTMSFGPGGSGTGGFVLVVRIPVGGAAG
jgi:signal transduction histidine kinase